MSIIKKFLILIVAITMAFGMPSCRNGRQAKQAVEMTKKAVKKIPKKPVKVTKEGEKAAKKLSGQTVKPSEKGEFLLKHGDDIIQQIELVKVKCTTCGGDGKDSWGRTCDDCDGNGFVYRVKMK